MHCAAVVAAERLSTGTEGMTESDKQVGVPFTSSESSVGAGSSEVHAGSLPGSTRVEPTGPGVVHTEGTGERAGVGHRTLQRLLRAWHCGRVLERP